MMDRRVRVGICGTGFARTAHLPGFRHAPGAEITAVFSAPLAEAQQAAQAFGVPRAYDDWRAMLAQEPLDLVTVAVPPALHFPLVMAALEADRHVLCEKPLGLNLAETRQMLALATERGRIHMLDHQLRFSPTYRRLKQLIDQGYAGRVHHVTWRNINSFRGDRQVPWNWWSDEAMGGGSLLAGASHAVDLVRWLFGEVRAVSGQLATWIGERPAGEAEPRRVTSDDQYNLLLELESGPMAWLFGSGVARHPLGMHLEIVGNEGTLLIDDQDRLWGAQAGEPLGDLSVPDPNAELDGVASHIWGIAFVGLARELVAAIHDARPLRAGATFYDGMRTQAVLDAARQSWVERRWMDVPAA